MFPVDPDGRTRVSRSWSVALLLAAFLAVAGAVTAFLHHREATRPVGEGELFAEEVESAALRYLDGLEAGGDPHQLVRAIRNDLAVEAVGVVAADGRFTAATAEGLVGAPLPRFLAAASAESRFAAIASPIDRRLHLDGVEEWQAGDVLYQVYAPFEAAGGILVYYDVSELLSRRAKETGLRPFTIAAAGVSLAMLLATGLLAIARQGARSRAAKAELERRFLRDRSRQLESHNRELEAARRRAERALELAEETNRVRSEFVLMINHELRTPLTSVVTGGELLRHSWDLLDHGERDRVLSDLVSDGRRLEQLISQMLVVARVENRSLEFELVTTTLADVRRRVCELSSRVAVWEPPGQDLPVRTDVDTLAQLVVSLAENAFTHGAGEVRVDLAHEPGFEPQLEVGTRPADGVFLVVSDDGPGIPHDFLPRIFEKFEKRGRASGTGLGLYLARTMVTAIDGSIAVATGPGGTRMAIGIPLAGRPAELVS